ncbi:Large1, partial [Symbiodinium sp. CCMP2456]
VGASDSKVVLATQLSSDRLPRLARLAAHWGGHVIAAVLCTGPEGRAVDPSRASRGSAWRKQCEDLCTATEALYPSVRLELLLLEWISDEEAFYPVNALRNFALSLAKHFEFVLQLDVDFLPSRNLRQLLESEVAALCLLPPAQLQGPTMVAVIVPALEPLEHTE